MNSATSISNPNIDVIKYGQQITGSNSEIKIILHRELSRNLQEISRCIWSPLKLAVCGCNLSYLRGWSPANCFTDGLEACCL